MRTLIVYYSRTGNTKRAAERLSTFLKADIIQIGSLEKFNGIFGFIKAILQARIGKAPEIAEINKDINGYDLVLLCSPVWAGKISSPARTFIIKYGDNIRKIGYLLVRGDRKNEYKAIWNAMDDLLHIKHVAAISLYEHSDFTPMLEDFANTVERLSKDE